jgi:hypothetical protein
MQPFAKIGTAPGDHWGPEETNFLTTLVKDQKMTDPNEIARVLQQNNYQRSATAVKTKLKTLLGLGVKDLKRTAYGLNAAQDQQYQANYQGYKKQTRDKFMSGLEALQSSVYGDQNHDFIQNMPAANLPFGPHTEKSEEYYNPYHEASPEKPRKEVVVSTSTMAPSKITPVIHEPESQVNVVVPPIKCWEFSTSKYKYRVWRRAIGTTMKFHIQEGASSSDFCSAHVILTQVINLWEMEEVVDFGRNGEWAPELKEIVYEWDLPLETRDPAAVTRYDKETHESLVDLVILEVNLKHQKKALVL